MNIKIVLTTTILLSTSTTTYAALYGRGNGMIYDSSLDITWLQDANFANTSGYTAMPGGQMTWYQADDWASNLVYAGISGWRLPSAHLFNSCGSYDGTCDQGYNNTHSEIGHLFTELGNVSAYTTTGISQSNYGLTNTTFIDAVTGLSYSFLYVQNAGYWEKELVASSPANLAWGFDLSNGAQYKIDKIDYRYGWAVHDGDVGPSATVPTPAAAWLFGSGLLGLAGVTKHRRKLMN